VVTIPHGVDTDIFAPQPASGRIRAELGIVQDAPVMGSIGRPEEIKGYDVLVRAFALLLEGWRGGTPPVLPIAGDGWERPRLEGLVGEHGVGSQMRLPGWRDDCTRPSPFSQSRSEGASVSLLEAMSAGLCPVVTKVGGNAAVFGPDLKHRLVRTEDSASLSEAVMRALSDAASCGRDGQTARRRVQEHFSLESMVSGYLALYDG
jgi:glycosyltransferase involved in cell wall biosynthesis